MLYHFLYQLKDAYPLLNIFKYITFRAVLSATTAFFVSIFFGPLIIRRLAELKICQQVRTNHECPDIHRLQSHKAATPTMGGFLILLSISVSVLLWADLSNSYILFTLFVTIALGGVGFLDDYKKFALRRSKGLGILPKFLLQVAIGMMIGWVACSDPDLSSRLDVPFLKKVVLDLGPFYILFVILVIVGSSNAVNLTDGLDGLAIGCVIMVSLTYSVLSYITGHAIFSKYLFIPFVPQAGELTVFCTAILGAGLGFLWFNCFPASIFMGDVGSLALGGAIGTIAVFIRKELLLMIVGVIFVVEALSVILQVASFRLRGGKRIFKIAPLHHHFQVLGFTESKVIVRFWIIGAILAVFTLATLKIR